MPKATFLNLNQEKQNRILDAAINEFFLHDYNDVTVSKIVKDAGIAKGSFYQYFEDKFDLFKYIIDIAGEKKKSYFLPVFSTLADDDFFELLSKIYKAGLKFAVENKKLAEIGTKLVRSTDKTVFNRIYNDMHSQVDDFIGPLLDEAIEKGEIRPDLDRSFLSYFFGQYHMILADYYFNAKRHEGLDDYLDMVDIMLDLFKNGVAIK